MDKELKPYTLQEHNRLQLIVLRLSSVTPDPSLRAAWNVVHQLGEANTEWLAFREALRQGFEKARERATTMAGQQPSYEKLEAQTTLYHILWTHWLFLYRYRNEER